MERSAPPFSLIHPSVICTSRICRAATVYRHCRWCWGYGDGQTTKVPVLSVLTIEQGVGGAGSQVDTGISKTEQYQMK